MTPKLNYPRIVGGSVDWMKRRDEEMKADATRIADLDEDADLRTVNRQLLAEIERLNQLVADLRAQQHQSTKTSKPKSSSKKSITRQHSPGKMVIDGVECVSVRHIHEKTGLHQSVISRQLSKAEIKPKVSGTTYYYPVSQVSDIKRKKSTRRR